jgi:hypothetical protein
MNAHTGAMAPNDAGQSRRAWGLRSGTESSSSRPLHPWVRSPDPIVPLDDVVKGSQIELLAFHLWPVAMLGERVLDNSLNQPARHDNLVSCRGGGAVTIINPRIVVANSAGDVRTEIIRRPDTNGDALIVALCPPAILDPSNGDEMAAFRVAHGCCRF